MVIHPNKPPPSPKFTGLINIALIGSGMICGALLALIGLWLWFDYQANPAHSDLSRLSAQAVTILPVWLQNFFVAQAQLMGLPLTRQSSAYWFVARSSGLGAYLLLWLSTLWGLLLSSKATGRIAPVVAYGLHEFLAILSIVFMAGHAFVLLGDAYVSFNILQLAVPFTASYEPFWTGLGSVAFYLTVVITASFYVRRLIGQKVWRGLHSFTFLAYLLALSHGLMAGTDSSLPIIKLIYWATGSSVLFFTFYRLLTLKALNNLPFSSGD